MNKEQLKELDRIAGELKALRDDVENTDIPVEVTSTTEQDKWQRVIDEKYLCKFWTTNPEVNVIPTIGYLARKELVGYVDGKGDRHDKCEVLREKGIKQPYFQGDDIPTHWAVLVYFKNNHHLYRREVSYLDNIDWSEVVAYIEV